MSGFVRFLDRFTGKRKFRAAALVAVLVLVQLAVGRQAYADASGEIRGPGGSGRCIDVAGDDTGATGAAVQLWDCLGVADQRWSIGGDGTIRTMGKCMDVDGYGTTNFSKIHLWDCHGGANQQWQVRADGSILNPVSGRCLDDNAGNTANGQQLQLYDCNGQWPQTWQVPTGTGGNGVTYSGNWTTGSGCGNQCYQGDDTYTNTTGDTATITFTGRQVILLSVKDVGNGIAGISIDGGPETTADLYGPVRDGQRVQYVSPVLSPGPHLLRMRDTGTHNPASGAAYIGFDRAEIYG